MLDYRYDSAGFNSDIVIYCDEIPFEVVGITKQTQPTYSLIFYNERTSFMNTNKFFAVLPDTIYIPLKRAVEVVVEFSYKDGTKISLPLNDDDLNYWQKALQDRRDAY